jgi:hypothetical protein
MEKLKQNGFWCLLAVIGAAIVASYFCFVEASRSERNKWASTLDKQTKDLDEILSKPAELPSQKQVRAYTTRLTDLQTDLADCRKWLKKYDDSLEKWFDVLPPNPTVGNFESVFNTDRQALEKELTDAGIRVGFLQKGPEMGMVAPAVALGGLNWETVGGPGSPSIKEVQKRYWIRRRVANVLLAVQAQHAAANVKPVASLEETAFFPFSRHQPGEEYPGWPTAPYRLPHEYGTVITCGIRAEMLNAVVPTFLKLLLEIDSPAPELLSHLRGVRIAVAEAPKEKEIETVEYPAGQNPEPLKQKKLAEMREKFHQPKPVRVFVTNDVFDFDDEKLSKPVVAAAGAK